MDIFHLNILCEFFRDTLEQSRYAANAQPASILSSTLSFRRGHEELLMNSTETRKFQQAYERFQRLLKLQGFAEATCDSYGRGRPAGAFAGWRIGVIAAPMPG
jgi:hypothetical protein